MSVHDSVILGASIGVLYATFRSKEKQMQDGAAIHQILKGIGLILLASMLFYVLCN